MWDRVNGVGWGVATRALAVHVATPTGDGFFCMAYLRTEDHLELMLPHQNCKEPW